jgi:hypothetical protein
VTEAVQAVFPFWDGNRFGRKARNVDLPGSNLHEEDDVIRYQA